MTVILVTGATSGPGVPLVERLRTAGHDVRAMSRRRTPDHVVADLATGAGLDAAVAGVDTIVHLATNRKDDLDDSRRLLDAATRAGVRHVVYLSIVGVDRIPLSYYRGKLATEEAIVASGIGYTILRATQFHSFPEDFLKMAGGRMFPRGLRVQPVGVGDVAERLTELAAAEPAGRVADLGGPEILNTVDVLRRLQAAGRAPRLVLQLALPGKTFAAYRAGHHLAGLPGGGTQSFDAWIATGSAR